MADIIKLHLHPVSDKHSIKEAVITFFLASKIIKPESFRVLIEKDLKDSFHLFDEVKQIQVKPGNNQMPEVREIENTGFKFVGYSFGGKAAHIIQGINEENRSFYSFHTLDYKDWNSFKTQSKEHARILSIHQQGCYILAYGLHYIDEFIWDNSASYNAATIFNKSDYLPKDAFDSSILDYQINMDKKANEYIYFDRLAINVSDKMEQKSIVISHNISFMMDKDPQLLDDLLEEPLLDSKLDFAHQCNKTLLRDLLTDHVCQLIHI
ncbi:hypothetical protein EZS27_026914 [termite gut metagenome]|uniref:TIGR04255 family protein n=1 Tax=termite gut metagenome TaxID=433724 RepID=A0A5J4QQ93_9ZZZZ